MSLSVIYTLIAVILLVVYAVVITWFYRGCCAVFTDKAIADNPPVNTFSIIVPYYNECENLPVLLKQLTALEYPGELFELVFVNDNSTDGSDAIMDKLAMLYTSPVITHINNTRKGKKAAIEIGVSVANKEFIVLTDADCRPSAQWLKGINGSLYNRQHDLLIMPVVTHDSKSWYEQLQELEFLSLIASTFGAIKNPFLCNAANLCFRKEKFIAAQPYVNNYHIKTGDDIFLLHAFKKLRARISFITDRKVWVNTAVKSTLAGFWEQRVRWSSKTISYTDPFTIFISMLVLLVNVILVTGFVMAGLYQPGLFYVTLGLFILKCTVDFILLYRAAVFFNKTYLLRWFLPLAGIYIFYVPLAAISGVIRNLTRYKK